MPKIPTRSLPPHPIEKSEAYKEYVSQPGLRDSDSVERSLTRFLRELAPCSLKELTSIHINHGLQRLYGLGYNPSYIKKLFMQARGFFAWCVGMNFLTKNPAFGLKLPRIENPPEVVVIDPEILERMHKHFRENGTIEQQLLWGALRMGARISEPCCATIGDVRLDHTNQCAFVCFRTKTKPRWAKQPRWTFPLYKQRLQEEPNPEAPLLELGGCALRRMDRQGKLVFNIDARTIKARAWIEEAEQLLFGRDHMKPKDMRSTFISMELERDPTKILVIADQVGNSAQVIQTSYLKHLQVAEFGSAEED